jgi:purine-binding chemotaxis protein CheW
MAEGATLELVVWRLGAQRYALPLSVVERVLPAAEVTPLPDAPDVVTGVLNFQGCIVPVVDMRLRLAQPQRDLMPGDQIVLAHTPRRLLAFCVDAVQGVVDQDAQALDGLIVVHDLERLLSRDEERRLDRALGPAS